MSLSKSDTYQLMVALARGSLEGVVLEKATSLIEKGVVLSDLMELSTIHGVRPLVLKNVRLHFNDWIPGGLSHALRQEEQAVVLRNRILAQEIDRLLSIFTEFGIRALPVKGAVLAKASYGDLNLRTFSDLDIIIEKGAFREALPLLEEVGYEPIGKLAEMSDLVRRFHMWQSGQCPFVKGKSIFHLDLHTRLMPPLYYYASDLDDLWERSVEVEIAGKPMRVLCPEDRILLMSYHGMKNRWERLKHVCDVSETLRSQPHLDWDFLIEEMKRTQGKRTLFVAIGLAKSILDVSLPKEIEQHVRNVRIEQVMMHLKQRLEDLDPEDKMQLTERFSFQLGTRDSLSTKMRYLYFAFLRRLTDLVVS